MYMKTLRNIFSVMLATVAMTGFFSCTEESPVYEPAKVESGAQVYFSQDVVAVTDYNIRGVESLPIQVNRVNKEADASIAVEATCDCPAIKFPAEVKFAAGEATANYVITIDQTGIAENTPYSICLKLTADTTAYGVCKYEFKVASNLPWIKFSKGHMTEAWWGEEEDETMYFQQVSETMRYCYISDCFDTEGGAVATDYYFYWNTATNEISVPMQYMGFTNGGLPVYVSDAAAFFEGYYGNDKLVANGYKDAADYAYNAQGYNRPYYDGNGGFYLGDFYYYDPQGEKAGSGFQFGGTQDCFIAETDENGTAFVRKDYTLEVAYVGKFFDKNDNPGVLAYVTPGADVENVRVAVCPKGSEQDCINGVLAESYAFAEIAAEGTAFVPFNEEPVDGKYTIVAISFGGGEAQELATASFSYEGVGPKATWHSLGTGAFVEDFVTTFFNVENVVCEVEIEESDETPGLYRLINPYGAAYPYNEEGDWDASTTYYMVVDATDPAYVWIPIFDSGMNWGYGNFIFGSYVGYYVENGYAPADCQAAGVAAGTLADGVISFPEKSCVIGMTEYKDGAFSLANVNGAFKVILPSAYTPATAPARRDVNRNYVEIAPKADMKLYYQPKDLSEINCGR